MIVVAVTVIVAFANVVIVISVLVAIVVRQTVHLTQSNVFVIKNFTHLWFLARQRIVSYFYKFNYGMAYGYILQGNF